MNQWIIEILGKLFLQNKIEPSNKEDIYFHKIAVKKKLPDKNLLKNNDFVEVVYKGKPYWVIFKCPCGCNNLISLPLSEAQNPRWSLKRSKNGIPTLYPSVWQNKGCLSHFWIIEGKIKWCTNTGIEPWIAEPKYYKKPREK